MTPTHFTAAMLAHSLVHCFRLNPLFRREQTEHFGFHAFVFDDLIGMNRRLLISHFANLSFVELSIRS